MPSTLEASWYRDYLGFCRALDREPRSMRDYLELRYSLYPSDRKLAEAR